MKDGFKKRVNPKKYELTVVEHLSENIKKKLRKNSPERPPGKGGRSCKDR